MNSRRMAIAWLSIFGCAFAFRPLMADAAVAVGTAAPVGMSEAMKNPIVPTIKSGPKTLAPPSTVKVFKQGECPLTKGSDGLWRGPDGKAVDDKLAHMGDCKASAR